MKKLLYWKKLSSNLKLILFLSVIQLCCFSTIKAVNYAVAYPKEIKFNWSTSNSYDAINIRKDISTDVPVPEWVYYNYSEPFAYIMGHNSNYIKVKFFSSCPLVDLQISVTVTSGTGIGTISQTLSNVAPNEERRLTINGTIPQNLNKYNFTWRWSDTATPKVAGYETQTIFRYTYHTYYTVFDEPNYPLEDTWTDVLDMTNSWAQGSTSVNQAITEITEAIHYSGFSYSAGGSHRYGHSYFLLTDFIDELGTAYSVNCKDMAHAVTSFSNAIGADLRISYLTDKIGKVYINCIDPLGSSSPTNNIFDSLAISEDCREGGFGWHAFAESSSSYIWDATFRYDSDGIPDNVVNSNPNCGSITTGYSWQLPTNVQKNTYISNVLDDWIKPGNGTAYDCSDRLDRADYSTSILYLPIY